MSDLDDRCLGVVPAFDQLLAGPHPLTVVQIAAGNTPNLMFSSTKVSSQVEAPSVPKLATIRPHGSDFVISGGLM
jgi:hypothetical protein